METDRVRAIVEALPGSVRTVGAFANQPAAFANDAADRAGLSHVQLHGDEGPAFASAMTRPVIKAISLAAGLPALEGWPDETI